MKILIATDMEGVTGVVNWDQVTPGHMEYARFRGLMTEDVNAAIRGACDSGADEILVSDGHWDNANIIIENLDPRARLCYGSPSPFSMLDGIDQDVDGVFFIGYHARAGSQNAILDHTWSTRSVANVWINRTLVGEYGLNAAVAGYFAVPILMISGDQTACLQASELLGPLEMAVVKRAGGRYSAECLTPPMAQEQIQLSARRAVERLVMGDAPDPYVVDTPVEIVIEFIASDQADRATLLPGSKRAGLRLTFSAPDMLAAYASFRAAITLADG